MFPALGKFNFKKDSSVKNGLEKSKREGSLFFVTF